MMEDIQKIIVDGRMDEMRHDAEVRRLRDPSWTDPGEDGGRAVGATRTRIGEWLIGVGTAIAGPAGDRRGGTADSAL
jgi:hypothetical protein